MSQSAAIALSPQLRPAKSPQDYWAFCPEMAQPLRLPQFRPDLIRI
jgi:hypothetical protein